jgi:hypothetical protein
MLNTILSAYLCLSYLAGIGFLLMVFSKDRQVSVGDLLILVLSPFSMVPIVAVQFVSALIDLETIVFRDNEF